MKLSLYTKVFLKSYIRAVNGQMMELFEKERYKMMKKGIWDHRGAEYYFSRVKLWTCRHGSHSDPWKLKRYFDFRKM